MALKLQSLVMIFAFLAASSALFGVSTGRKIVADDEAEGPAIEVDPVNPEDPKIVELAKFVVAEYSKTFKKDAIFGDVIEAINYADFPSGTKYRLLISVAVSEGPQVFAADVVVDRNSTRVVAFDP